MKDFIKTVRLLWASASINAYHIVDKHPSLIRECEIMAKFVCDASDLRSDDCKFKHTSLFMKSCTLCDYAAYKNVDHLIMTCSYNTDLRIAMFNDSEMLCNATPYLSR